MIFYFNPSGENLGAVGSLWVSPWNYNARSGISERTYDNHREEGKQKKVCGGFTARRFHNRPQFSLHLINFSILRHSVVTMFETPSYSAIVTGGASGIGEAVCVKLASRGINILIADIQEAQGQILATRLSLTFSVEAKYLRVDITREDDVKMMVQTAVRLWGRLDYAANCAGICESTWAEEKSITTEVVNRQVHDIRCCV